MTGSRSGSGRRLARCSFAFAIASVAGSLMGSPTRASDELSTRLAADGRAFVVVMLEQPRWPSDVSKQAELTARLQEEALAGPLASGFDVVRRFQTVPALAGWLTPQGYARAREEMSHGGSPVRAIDLDVSGNGELSPPDDGSGRLADTVPLIDADVVHEWGFTGAGVEVAILDTGIDTNHPDLASSLLSEHCFCYRPVGGCCPNGQSTQSGAGSAEDDHGHGSHVSGIVTSDGVVAAPGVAPGAGITMVKMVDSNNSFYSSSDIVAGLDWINANRPGVDVVSMSLQTNATFSGACDNTYSWTQALYAAVQNLVSKNVMVVAIAGNGYLAGAMVAPGCLSNVFNVGATDKSDVAASFSNSHELVAAFAPGVSVTSDWPGGGTATLSGTSMACPHVSALSALIRSALPKISRTDLAFAITSSGVPVTDWNGITHPRIDADDAMLAAGLVFADGFTSGDTSRWSTSAP